MSGPWYHPRVNIVTLHVLLSEQSADFGMLRFAAPALEPDARVALWEGLPPPAIPEHPGIATVVLQGDLEHHRCYAEQVPQGMRLSDVHVPASLSAWVGAKLLDALLALHEGGEVHGRIAPDRVVLGVDGRVVVIGRGRRGGTEEHDRDDVRAILRALGVQGTTEEPRRLCDRLTAAADPTDGQALGSLITSRRPEGRKVIERLHLHVGPMPSSLDEVVPDLGPDKAEPGLLDRWALTSQNTGESTAELTDGGRTAASPMVLTLWTRLAAPPEHPMPGARFRQVQGVASRGLQVLLAEEPPDGLPALLAGDVPPFLLGDTESPTDHPFHDTFETTDPELTPGIDDDPDTVIYDMSQTSMRAALLEADAKTIDRLEKRLADAERRATASDRALRDLETRLRKATERTEPRGVEPTGVASTQALRGFLRVEVFVALAIGGLIAWLALRAFG